MSLDHTPHTTSYANSVFTLYIYILIRVYCNNVLTQPYLDLCILLYDIKDCSGTDTSDKDKRINIIMTKHVHQPELYFLFAYVGLRSIPNIRRYIRTTASI